MAAFIVRVIAGLVFAFIAMRFFHSQAHWSWTLALAALLVGLAYIKEAFRIKALNKNTGRVRNKRNS